MASNAHISSTGYEVKVVGDFLPHLNCGICLLIMKNATHGCSKHVFCEGCILKHIESGIRTDGKIMCPGGCGKCIDSSKLDANEYVDRMVNTLSTKCSNHLCNWQGDLLDLVQVHQLNCEFTLQSCDNKGCDKRYLKKDFLQHDEVCLYKLMECTYCHTDIIRINKENHEVECANKKVKCEYYDIGCKNEFCRRDVFLHEDTHQARHMRLIYQQLLTSTNEVTILKQENTVIKEENVVIKQQNTTIKQENVVMKEKYVEIVQGNIGIKEENGALKKTLEVLNEEVTQLKLEVKTNATDFQEFKQNNLKPFEKIKNLDVDASKNEAVSMKLNEELRNIDQLKQRLSMVNSLHGKVSLVNDDKVLFIKTVNNLIVFYNDDLHKSYEKDGFHYLMDKFDLEDHKNIMMELLNSIQYHLYEFKISGKQWYRFVFPLDLSNIKDMEVLVPDILHLKILNNEIIVNILNQILKKKSYLTIKNKQTLLKQREKYNLKDLECNATLASQFAHGYAYILLIE